MACVFGSPSGKGGDGNWFATHIFLIVTAIYSNLHYDIILTIMVKASGSPGAGLDGEVHPKFQGELRGERAARGMTMQRKSFDAMTCPIARSLERVGEWWSILILRDAFAGLTRFDDFQKRLGIAPNILTRRLSTLVEAGMLERRSYSERPPRYEYVLTDRGRDFRDVLIALLAFGNRHFAPEGESALVVDAVNGLPADPVMVDRKSGRPLATADFKFAAGPAAIARQHAAAKQAADAVPGPKHKEIH
jgi:DNA-binding HxlR family transcriptional regulator